MDRIPGGSGIEPMLSVLETHIYQVSSSFKKTGLRSVIKLTGGIGTIFVGGSATFFLPDLDPDQELAQKLNTGQILRPKIAKVAKETILFIFDFKFIR